MKIEITLATNKRQTAIINNKEYEFEFTSNDLAESIEEFYTSHELSLMCGLNPDDNTSLEMAKFIAYDLNDDDLIRLIQDFITENPANLIDHLIESK